MRDNRQVSISMDSDARAEFVAELNRIDEDVIYYALTMTAGPDGQMQWSTQTQYTGVGSKPMWEMRAASSVYPDKMRAAWKALGQGSIVVSTQRALLFFMRSGGNAVIAEPLFKQWFSKLLEPTECPPSRFGEGVRSVATLTKAQLQHAPSRKVRMEALKRDQFRCKSCGQRPSEDVNVELHVHHVRPFGQGGLTEMHNLLTLCQTCHTGLDPHFEWQLLEMIPDGLIAPTAMLKEDCGSFTESVRRYREAIATQLEKIAAETSD